MASAYTVVGKDAPKDVEMESGSRDEVGDPPCDLWDSDDISDSGEGWAGGKVKHKPYSMWTACIQSCQSC